ncbi:MAG: hypothetical protein H6937_02530 [Burkholderiales bacterium]|nr:hypothetical protein [Burkholderiales bacterium]
MGTGFMESWQSFSNLFGIKILRDTNCTRETKTPVRKHNKKSNISYHKRIQKKWNKRYGFEHEYTAVKFNDGQSDVIICHPAIYNEIIKNIRSAYNPSEPTQHTK